MHSSKTRRTKTPYYSDLQVVWDSVDELKAGLDRTERKLENIRKEPWKGLSNIRQFSSDPGKVLKSKTSSGLGKSTSRTLDRQEDQQNTPGTHRPSKSKLLKTSSETQASSTRTSSVFRKSSYLRNGGGANSMYNGDSENEGDSGDTQVRYLNVDIPPSLSTVGNAHAGLQNPRLSAGHDLSDELPTKSKEVRPSRKTMKRQSPKESGDGPADSARNVVVDIGRYGTDDAAAAAGGETAASSAKTPRRASHSNSFVHFQVNPSNVVNARQCISTHETRQKNRHGKGGNVELPQEGSAWSNVHKLDGLEKLRKIVQKQQQELNSAGSSSSAVKRERALHRPSDPVCLVSAMSRESGNQKRTTLVRKVAPAPPVPSYPGFSTPSSSWVRKVASQEAVPGKKKKSEKEKRDREVGQNKKPPKTKKVAKITTANVQDYIICPTSWRKGQELILNELGPFKPTSSKPKHPSEGEKTDTAEKDGSVSSRQPSRAEEGNAIKNVKSAAADLTGVKQVLAEMKKPLSLNLDNASNDDSLHSDHNSSQVSENAQNDNRQSPSSNIRPTANRPKPSNFSETEKYQIPKVRHYDTDAVRSYISKQRKERNQRLQEERQKKKQEAEGKKQKLQELQQLQKKLAQAKVTKDAVINKSEAPSTNNPDREAEQDKSIDETQRSQLNVLTLLNVEQRRRIAFAASPADLSRSNSNPSLSSSSTSLEVRKFDSDENLKTVPRTVASPSVVKERHEDSVNPELVTANIVGLKEKSLGQLATSCQHGMDAIMNKLQPFLTQENYEPTQYPANGIKGETDFNDNEGVSKSKRIEMLRATAESLQIRLAEETARLTQGQNDPTLSGSFAVVPGIRSAITVDGNGFVPIQDTAASGKPIYGQREAVVSSPPTSPFEFLPRYERLVRSKHQFTVYQGNLPGVNNLMEHAQLVANHQRRHAAATKVQAAFRGYRVRQNLKWRLPTGKSIAARSHVFKVPLDQEEEESGSTLSEGPLVDDHQSEPDQLGNSLFRTEFCAGRWRPFVDGNQSALSSRVLTFQNTTTTSQKPDPLNFINTLQKKLQKVDVWVPLSPKRPEIDLLCRKSPSPRPTTSNARAVSFPAGYSDKPDSTYADDFEPTSSKVSQSSAQGRFLPLGAEAPTGNRQQASPDNSTSELDSFPTKSHSDSVSQKKHSSATITFSSTISSDKQRNPDKFASAGKVEGFKTSTPMNSLPTGQSVHASSESGVFAQAKNPVPDDFLSEGTLSEGNLSFESESTATRSAASSRLSLTLSEKQIDSPPKIVSQPSISEARASTVSSEGVQEQQRGYHGFSNVLQFSPDVLRLRMSTELNYLDSVEESLRQLSTVERMQAVALAQQETVSLAQVLQNEQQKKSREMEQAQHIAQREAEAHRQALQDASRRHEEVLASAVESVIQVRTEASSAINTTTQKLLETQAEAAKATAEAAKQLAEANVATLNFTANLQTQNATQLATETATSAAVAAVSSALKHLQHRSSRRRRSSDYSDRANSSSGESGSVSSGSRTRSSSDRSSNSREPLRTHEKSSTTQKSLHHVSHSISSIPELSGLVQTVESPSASTHQKTKRVAVVSPSVSSHSPISVKSYSPGGSPIEGDHTISEGSLPEEIVAEEDYSANFEETVTEEETEEQLFRKILPSESHRRQTLGKSMKHCLPVSVIEKRIRVRSRLLHINTSVPLTRRD